MELADLTSQTTTEELWAVYDEHGEPFESLDQCKLFLRAASILRRRLPAETESGGDRITLRDIDVAMQQARKFMGVHLLASEPAASIVPPDVLR